MSAVDPLSGNPPAFCIRLEREGGRVVVAAEGELDISTVDELRTEVVELAVRGCTRIVLDLSRLTFADSCAIHLLLELEAAAAVDGFAFAVRLGEGTPAQRLLTLAGLAQRFASA